MNKRQHYLIRKNFKSCEFILSYYKYLFKILKLLIASQWELYHIKKQSLYKIGTISQKIQKSQNHSSIYDFNFTLRIYPDCLTNAARNKFTSNLFLGSAYLFNWLIGFRFMSKFKFCIYSIPEWSWIYCVLLRYTIY